MKQTSLAYWQLGIAMAIVGGSVVMSKWAAAVFPVFLASGLRFAIALAILIPLLYIREGEFPTVGRSELLLLFLQAFAGIFLFSVLLLYGVSRTTAAESGIITGATPALAGLLAFLFLKETLSGWKWAGIAITACGIIVIHLAGSAAGTREMDSAIGNLLVFGAVLGEAVFITLGKLMSERLSPLAISVLISMIGFVLFLPFALFEAASFDFSKLTAYDWLPVVYLGVGATVISFSLWYAGLSVVSASTAAVFTGIMPVSAVLLSYLWLGEPFSWSHAVGIAGVLAGIVLITKIGEAPGKRV